MRFFRYLLRQSALHMVLASVAGIVGGASMAWLIASINHALTMPVDAEHLATRLGALIAVVLAARVVSQILLVHASQDIVLHHRTHLSRMVSEITLAKLEQIGLPRVAATLNYDVSALYLAAPAGPQLTINVTIVLACLAYLAVLSWRLFLLVIVAMAIGTVMYVPQLIRVRRQLRMSRNDLDVLQRHFRALMDGAKELRLNRVRREAFLTRTLTTTARALRLNTLEAQTRLVVASAWSSMLLFVVVGAVVAFGARLSGASSAVLVSFTVTLLTLLTPLDVVTSWLVPLANAGVALEHIEQLGLALGEAPPQPSPPPASTDWDALELVGVRHSYANERENRLFTLGPIKLRIARGALVFVVGPNGCGKSTLAKVLTGLYTPEGGAIHLGGEVIRDDNREWYRQHFSAVFSDFYVPDALQGLSGDDLDERAAKYLKLLQIDHKVRIEGGTFSSTALSTGQRKRLALVIAYLEDRPIYVFDEWASDQDPYFKQVFYQELLPELRARGKTVIAITHDDRYFHIADELIKLEDGQLVAADPQSQVALRRSGSVA